MCSGALNAPEHVATRFKMQIGHVQLELLGSATTVRQVTGLWERLFVLESEELATSKLRFELVPRPLLEVAGKAVYSARALSVRKTATGFFLRCGDSSLRVDLGANTAHCYLAEDFEEQSVYEKREFFLLALMMLVRPHGLYGLHGNGLLKDDLDVLIVGQSGSGKTTTTLNLIRSGWQYLSDDALLLREAKNTVEALAFRKGFSCTPETLQYFGELPSTFEFGDPEGKRVLDMDETFGGGFTRACTPNVLLFPKLTNTKVTRLQPLASVQALILLSQQSAGIMTDTAVSQQQLHVLQRLVQQTQSYHLLLGSDALEGPYTVATLLANLHTLAGTR
mgnify:FL=1